MLNQCELNFYGWNRKNIIKRENRGHISCEIRYDKNIRLFVVTRRTPKTLWQDRYKDYNNAYSRYLEFLYSTGEQLENELKKEGTTCF